MSWQSWRARCFGARYREQRWSVPWCAWGLQTPRTPIQRCSSRRSATLRCRAEERRRAHHDEAPQTTARLCSRGDMRFPAPDDAADLDRCRAESTRPGAGRRVATAAGTPVRSGALQRVEHALDRTEHGGALGRRRAAVSGALGPTAASAPAGPTLPATSRRRGSVGRARGERSMKVNHASVRLGPETLTRVDALIPYFKTVGRPATRSDVLRALISSGLTLHDPARLTEEETPSPRRA